MCCEACGLSEPEARAPADSLHQINRTSTLQFGALESVETREHKLAHHVCALKLAVAQDIHVHRLLKADGEPNVPSDHLGIVSI